MLSTVYSPAQRVSVGQTLRPLRRGYADPTFQVDATGIWRTLRTPAGPATMHLAQHGHDVEARAWGPGAEWAIAGVPELLGSGDDWSDLDLSASLLLSEARRRNPGLRLLRTRQVFEMLLVAVLEQKVTGLQARQSWRWLLAKHGEPAPGPAPKGMRVFPAAEVWRRVPSWDWHRAGVGPQRADTIMRAVTVAASLERTVDDGRGGPAVERKLRTIPGVGIWTAAETMQRAHGDPDSPSVGDYNLPRLVGWTLVGRPVDDDGMLELLEPWRGDRQRVVRLIELVGRMPRFAPRITIQDHRGH
jgi:3-methyladenine DNA glycosylase/8-oxoguanine DNA glycosylase